MLKNGYEDLYNECLDMLENNDDIFIECIKVLDGINGILEGKRVYEMDEIDDYFYGCKASTILKNIDDDFDINDNYFYEDDNKIYSIDSNIDFYRDILSSQELLDFLIEEYIEVCWNKYRFMEDFEISFTDLCEVYRVEE